MRIRIWCVLLALCLLPVTGCPGTTTTDNGDTPAEIQVYYFPLDTDPPTLDPAQVTDTVSDKVIRSLFDGLVKHNPDGEIVPAIAESWDIDDTATVYTFHLREGVKFHNGREVIADDFAYSFRRVLEPDTSSPRVWVLDKIMGATAFNQGEVQEVEGINVIDDYTLELTLEQPFAPFLGLMCMSSCYVVPQEVIEGSSDEFASNPSVTVGTGPWILREWEHNNQLVMDANPDYFMGAPKLGGLTYKIIAEPSGRLQEFRAGNLHHTEIPPDLYDEIMSNPEEAALVVRRPLVDVYNLGFNCQKEPFKDNPTLRKAFCYAIDRDYLINTILNGLAVEATGIVPPGIGTYNANLPGYPYNETEARRLLAEAGYPDGEGLPEISLYYDIRPPRPDICQVVKQNLARVGVNINLRPLEWSSFLEAVDAGEPEFFQLTWVADYLDPENFLFVLLHSSQWGPPGNGTRYSSPEFDSLIEQAGIETDTETRWELYAEAERITHEDAPWLPLYWNECAVLVAPEVHGLEISALDRPPVLPSVEIENVWFEE